MARGGRRPKPPRLRLVDGSFRSDRHGPKERAQKAAAIALASFGKIERPPYLKGEARKAWDLFIAPCSWLDGSKAPAAIIFVELWAEFRAAPTAFQAAKYAQLRGVMSDLGLTDERNRTLPEAPEEDEFFGDDAG